jgi:hypothetical protein
MKKIIFAILLLTSFSSVKSQYRYGLFSYLVPDGFALANTGDASIVYSHKSDADNIFHLLTISKEIKSSGTATTDFNNRWKIVTSQLGVSSIANLEPAIQAGCYTLLKGTGAANWQGYNCTLQLVSITGYNITTNYFLFGNNPGYYKKPLETFTKFLSINRPAGEIAKACEKENPTYLFQSGATPQTPTTVSITSNNGSSIRADVWMNVQSNALYGGGGYWSFTDATRIKFYFIYPDGDYCSEMPFTGLQTFDKEKSKSSGKQTWGKFTMQNDNGAFVSQYENVKVKKVSATKMEKIGYTYGFAKCASVDGLKLNGAWSYIPNWSKDPKDYYRQPGCRQIIYFKTDGSFDDRGIFVADSRYPNKHAEDAPGKGTYSISNFTLILKYDDGRTIYKAFSGVADRDPAVNDEVVYIGTNPFYKN